MNTATKPGWTVAADDLARILQAENKALLSGNFTAAAAMLPAKRAAIQAVDSQPPIDHAQAFGERLSRLSVLAAENRRLLARSISIQSQLLGIIAGAARTASAFGYRSSGKSAIRGGAFSLSAKA